MNGGIIMDNLVKRFSHDDNEIISLRNRQINDIDNIQYPKIGKIKLTDFNLDKLNVMYVKEEKHHELGDINKLIDDDDNIIVLKDGNIIYTNLDQAFQQVKIMSYYDALTANDGEVINLFKERFNKNVDNKLIALNKAYQNSLLYISVPQNVVIKETLKIHIIGEKSDLIHYTMIVGGKSSELTIVEKIENLNPIKVNYLSEVRVLDNAKIQYIGIDRLSEKTNAFIGRYGYVYDNGSLIYALGQLNDGNVISDNVIKLLGKNANGESRNVLLTDKTNIHAVTVNIEHLAPYSNGKITNHGIVKDQGYLHVDGIGKINQGMSKSNSLQQTSIITLSKDAKVDSNPYLLIDEYDVMAGHGAAVGKVDSEQLYYLMSRGLSKQEAEKLIILGFLYPIIELIESDKIKTNFIKTIEKKLSI